jgi:predicted small secreted protein
MKRTWSLLLAVLLAAALLGGCGAGSAKKMDSTSTASAPQEAAARDSVTPQSAPAVKNPGTGGAAVPAGAPVIPDPDRKIIQNASFDIKIKDGDAVVNKLTATVSASGGWVQDVKQSGTKETGRTINMTVRVPGSAYTAITTIIRELGDITQQHEWAQDVTDQYVDLEARIKTTQTHLDQLNKLYAQGGTIKDMMEVENEVARVTADLESMKGRMRVLSNQVDFSTLVINLYEPGVPAPLDKPKTVGERISRGFTESWHGVVNFTGDLIVALVTALPVLVYVAILGGLIYLIVRAVLKWQEKRRNHQ